jgi:hypothetical protein
VLCCQLYLKCVLPAVSPAGPHVFYNCPSGNYYDYKAFAMGARSQVGGTHAVHVQYTCGTHACAALQCIGGAFSDTGLVLGGWTECGLRSLEA